jgi:hypothetical protein
MLTVIIEGGARPSNVFVFEDDLSRPNRRSDPDVASMSPTFYLMDSFLSPYLTCC